MICIKVILIMNILLHKKILAIYFILFNCSIIDLKQHFILLRNMKALKELIYKEYSFIANLNNLLLDFLLN